jgi:hypothetical protein
MKLNRLLIICILSTAAIFISTTAISQNKVKYLVGKWIPAKVERINVVKVQPITNTNNGGKTGNSQEPAKTEDQIKRFIQSEERTQLIIKADKTAEKDYIGKVIHAKWKLTKHGTKLAAKSTDTGKKMTYDILRLNDTLMIVMGHYPFGDLKLTYKKDKSGK